MTYYFSRIQVDTYAQMHTRVKLLGGCRCRPYSNYWGGYSQIIGGDISSPGFGTPASKTQNGAVELIAKQKFIAMVVFLCFGSYMSQSNLIQDKNRFRCIKEAAIGKSSTIANSDKLIDL